MLKGHGDDRHLFDCEIKADFSSNVIANHPLQLPHEIQERCWKSIERYPEPNGESLRKALADFHKLSDEQILVTNGATEAFYLLAKNFERQSATILIPTFSEYQDACRIHHISTKLLPWDALASTVDIQSALVFICNPNNPTGQAITMDRIRLLLEQYPNSYFIIDEAYVDFSDQCESVIGLFATYKNLIIVKSLTKSFAIAGLRLGYILAHESVVTAVTKHKMPWSNNSIALTIGLHLVENYHQLLFDRRKLRAETEWFRAQINAIDGVKALPTSTNYFLVDLGNRKATDLKQFLVEKQGILIRDASNFDGLGTSYCRLACQAVEKNQLFIKALKEWMH